MMNSDKKSRGIIIFLSIALIIIGLLSYQNARDYSVLQNAFIQEKNDLKLELEKIITDYDEAITSKINVSSRLRRERIRVVQLRDSIDLLQEKNFFLIKKYRKRIINLEKQNKLLFAKVDSLQTENIAVREELTEREKLSQKLTQTNKTLKNNNQNLERKIALASNLKIDDLTITPLKKRSNGKYTSTSRARKTEAFKVSFDILKNNIAKSGPKKIYVQVLDMNKNIISADGYITLKNKRKMVYSDVFTGEYNNQEISMVNLVQVEKGFIKKGKYLISIYIEKELMNRKFVELK